MKEGSRPLDPVQHSWHVGLWEPAGEEALGEGAVGDVGAVDAAGAVGAEGAEVGDGA